jgi:SSS family solute:Na+ symporter
MSLHLTVLLVYAVVLMGIGLWIGRTVRSSAEFFVAGRQLGPSLLFSTMLAANIGAGSTVAAAGLGYADGLSAWWWVGSAGLGSIVLAFWIGPRIRRVAADHELRTLGDYLEYRFGEQVRATITVLLWMGTLAILSAQIIGIGWVLNVVVGLPPWLGCLTGGLVVIVYFTAGGLLTAAWVNALQLVVLLAGFVVALPLAVTAAGGWGEIYEATRAVDADYWNPWQGGNSGWFYLVMLGPAFIISPGLLQKTYGARDDRTVRLGVGLNAVVLLVFAAMPPLLGMIARAVEPALDNPELALPTLLNDVLPPAVGALGLAALFSAEVSSSDAILFMLATSLSQDLYRRYVDPDASDRQLLTVARRAAVTGGILGTGLAIVAASIASVLQLFYTLLTVSLFVPVLGGLYTRRVGPREAMGAIAGGVSSFAAVQVLATGERVLGMTPAMIGLLGALVCCGVVMARRAQA